MKKLMLLMMAFTLLLAFGVPDSADAKRGGGKSGRSGFTQTPSKPAQNVQRSDSSTAAKSPASTTAGPTANRGFFSGGGLMKGLMIGGLAGMLFGSMFGGMGFMGDILGLMINLLAIFLLFVAIRAIFTYFRNNRKRVDDNRRPY